MKILSTFILLTLVHITSATAGTHSSMLDAFCETFQNRYVSQTNPIVASSGNEKNNSCTIRFANHGVCSLKLNSLGFISHLLCQEASYGVRGNAEKGFRLGSKIPEMPF